jgi:hypothetical protein
MRYTIEDLFDSINDIYYQLDEGKMRADNANNLARNCCLEFLKQFNDVEPIEGDL